VKWFGDTHSRWKSLWGTVAKSCDGIIHNTGIGNSIGTKIPMTRDHDRLVNALSLHHSDTEVSVCPLQIFLVVFQRKNHSMRFERSNMMMTVDHWYFVNGHCRLLYLKLGAISRANVSIHVNWSATN
jgi:hypothetical protein